MVLGHEAAGTVVEIGANVRSLEVGDRVCMEPGVPNFRSKRDAKLGLYNVDPEVTFWATPPVHGCLTQLGRPSRGLHLQAARQRDASPKARWSSPSPSACRPRRGRASSRATSAVVLGAGPIGIMVALARSGGRLQQVLITDRPSAQARHRRPLSRHYPGQHQQAQMLVDAVKRRDRTAGAPTSSSRRAARRKRLEGSVRHRARAGAIVLVGMPVEPVAFDIPRAIGKELRIETVFRYANIFERALNLIASGKVDLKPLISVDRSTLSDRLRRSSVPRKARPADVKLQIDMTKAVA